MVLMKVDVPIVTNSSCDNVINLKENGQFRAGGYGCDTCHRDSGGPVVCVNGTNRYFCGIVSSFAANEGCGTPGIPGNFILIKPKFRYSADFVCSYEEFRYLHRCLLLR